MANKQTTKRAAKAAARKLEAAEAASEKTPVIDVEVTEKGNSNNIPETIATKQMFAVGYKIPNTNMTASTTFELTVTQFPNEDGSIGRTTLSWRYITHQGKIDNTDFRHCPLVLFTHAVESLSIVSQFIEGHFDAAAEEEEAAKGTRKWRYNWSEKPDGWDDSKGKKPIPFLRLEVKDVPEKKWQYIPFYLSTLAVPDMGSIDLRSWQRLMHPEEEKLRKCIKDENIVEKLLEATTFEHSDKWDPSCLTGWEVKAAPKEEKVSDDEWLD